MHRIALLLGLLTVPPRAEQDPDPVAAAIATLTELGARVQPLAMDSDAWTVNFSIGGKAAGDAALEPLAALQPLFELNLGFTKISDAGLKRLAGRKDLVRLYLHQTAVTDAGLGHLAKLESLEYLNLYGTKVTDTGILHLKELRRLRKLFLWQTAVTKEGAAALQEHLDEVVIDLGWTPPPKVPPEEEAPKTCCELAKAENRACDHPCCVAAAKAGKVCEKCNPPKPG